MTLPHARPASTPDLRLCAAMLVLAGALGGCARVPPVADIPPWEPDTAGCLERFERSDAAIAAAGVVDGEAHRVPGFPFLRTNRFLASFLADDVAPAARDAWIARAAELDRSGRAVELENAGADASQDTVSSLEACRAKLAAAVSANALRWRVLRERVRRVPDDYTTWQRYLGLYPLTSRFVLAGVERLHERATPLALTDGINAGADARTWYGTTSAAVADTGDAAPLPYDALGVPLLTPERTQRMLAAHAPAFAVTVRDDNDRIGEVRYDGEQIMVDTAQPRVYAYPARTRFEDAVLVQLVYTVWFPARPLTGTLDLLGGALDAVTWRVTLDTDGAPLLYDAMHACGCYHMFFPTTRLARRARADLREEPLWVPFVVPDSWNPALALHLEAGTHYLTAVSQRVPGTPMRALPITDYDVLRRLDDGTGATRSLFDEHGLVPASRRAERWVLWPMGIRSPGAMRQRGRHATAFVGRRHFDEARLIERYFTRTGLR